MKKLTFAIFISSVIISTSLLIRPIDVFSQTLSETPTPSPSPTLAPTSSPTPTSQSATPTNTPTPTGVSNSPTPTFAVSLTPTRRPTAAPTRPRPTLTPTNTPTKTIEMTPNPALAPQSRSSGLSSGWITALLLVSGGFFIGLAFYFRRKSLRK